MKKRSLLEIIERFELHHQMLVFILVFLLTILITRILVLIHDPTPIIANFELHHFDYGLLLLIIVSLLVLFQKKFKISYLVLTSISIALIADDYWFIRTGITPPIASETAFYNTTWPYAIIFAIVIPLLVLLINFLIKKYRNN